MIALIILSLISVISFVIARYTNNWSTEDAMKTICICSTVVLGVVLLTIPISRNSWYKDAARLEAFKATVEASRKSNPTDIERVSMLQSIAAWNEFIAQSKYENAHSGDLWVPDQIEQVEFIK